jgi:hypothetical protein
MLVFILGGIPWQVYFQRVLSAKTEKSAMYLSFIAAVGCILAGKIRCYNRAIYFEKVFYNSIHFRLNETTNELLIILISNSKVFHLS